MPLSCFCDDNYDYYAHPDKDFAPLDAKRAKRCQSCNTLIKPQEDCLGFYCYRYARTDIEERIYGDEVPLAYQYLCESCGGLYMAFEELGFCVSLNDNMRELVRASNTVGPVMFAHSA